MVCKKLVVKIRLLTNKISQAFLSYYLFIVIFTRIMRKNSTGRQSFNSVIKFMKHYITYTYKHSRASLYSYLKSIAL